MEWPGGGRMEENCNKLPTAPLQDNIRDIRLRLGLQLLREGRDCPSYVNIGTELYTSHTSHVKQKFNWGSSELGKHP